MHSLLRDINDMGELRSEHPGNLTYWLFVFKSWFCGTCACGAVVITICVLFGVDPNDVSIDSFLVVSVVCGLMVLAIVYVIRRNNRTPLLFALYEKGLVVVYSNRTIRRFFLDDINEIHRHEHRYYLGLGKPILREISLHLRCFEELNTFSNPIRIPAEFFQDVEKLYNSIYETKVNIDTPD